MGSHFTNFAFHGPNKREEEVYKFISLMSLVTRLHDSIIDSIGVFL